MQRHAALGERKRLVVLVAHECHVRLVVDDTGDDVVGLDGLSEPLALAECPRCLTGSAGLGEQDRRQSMDERQMPAVPSCVEG